MRCVGVGGGEPSDGLEWARNSVMLQQQQQQQPTQAPSSSSSVKFAGDEDLDTLALEEVCPQHYEFTYLQPYQLYHSAHSYACVTG